MQAVTVVLIVLSIALTGSVVWGEPITVTTAPPVVVQTVPQAGATDVDPTLTEIKVTFSKDMLDGSWTWWKLSDETFPTLTAQPQFKDKRTCVLPVQLAPGKTYVLWINTEKTGNFKDTNGQASVPYLLVFQTRQ